ncbi:MAG: flagellin [Sulfurimonas sp.]|nr:flagellin [Sulfurimonas sp.]
MVAGTGGGDFTFQTGAYSGDTQTISIGDASMNQLNIDGGGFGFLNTNPITQADFEQLIKDMDDTIVGLNAKRATIGASQNKLESTIRNISTTQVNIESARSQIQDVDFANESAQFAKHNILAQSGSFAMSQANSSQNNVLSLFQ